MPDQQNSNPSLCPSLICLGKLDAAVSIVNRSRADGRGERRVDCEDDPGKEAVTDGVAQLDVVEERIAGAIDRSLGNNNLVIGVEGHCVGVGVVRRQQLDGITDGLIPEGLANVRGGQIVDGAVGASGGAPVQDGVDVSSAASTKRKRAVLSASKFSGFT